MVVTSNDYSVIVRKILSRAIITFRESSWAPILVSKDFSSETASQGDTIDFTVGATVGTADVVPSHVPSATPATTLTKRSLPLNKWRKSAAFGLSHKQMVEIDRSEFFLPLQIQEAVRGLVNYMHTQILANYTYAGAVVGEFATNGGVFSVDSKTATAARGELNKTLCPSSPRFGLLHIDDEIDATNLADFKDADKAGTALTKMEGNIGRKFGANWLWDNVMPTHTEAQAGTALVDDAGAIAVGATTIHMDGFTTKPERGDCFRIAGDTTTYKVVSSTALAGTDSDVTFLPALRVAIATGDGNEAVTFQGNYRVNLLFHPQAFALAQRRIFTEPDDLANGNFSQITDPQTGISLRLERLKQYKQTSWEFDVLFGTESIYHEYSCLMIGGVTAPA